MPNSQPLTNEIRVSGGTHPTTLSGYIHTSLNAYDKTCVVAVGPKAISTAMKAIAVARLNIAGTDKDIVAMPEFAEIIMDDIKVNGNPLTESGKDIVGEALDMAVKEGNNPASTGDARVHVGMKIFLEQINRVVDTVNPNHGNQTRNNSTDKTKQLNQNKNNKNTQGKNRTRKPLTEREMFLAHTVGKKQLTTNSNGIPRV